MRRNLRLTTYLVSFLSVAAAGAATAQDAEAPPAPKCLVEGVEPCPEDQLAPLPDATGAMEGAVETAPEAQAATEAVVEPATDAAAEPPAEVAPELAPELASETAAEAPEALEAQPTEPAPEPPATPEVVSDSPTATPEEIPMTEAEPAPSETAEDAAPQPETVTGTETAAPETAPAETAGDVATEAPVAETPDAAPEAAQADDVSAEPPAEAPSESMAEEPAPEPDRASDATTDTATDTGTEMAPAEETVIAEPATTAPEEIAAPVDEAVRAQAAQNPEVQEAVSVLEGVLGGAAAAAAVAGSTGEAAEATATEAPAGATDVGETTTREIVETRSAAEEFSGTVLAAPAGATDAAAAAAAAAASAQDKERREKLEAAGLGALAGLAIGALIFDRQEVVATTPERVVVVDRETNAYQVWRDDDSILRRPGTREETTTYRDGSTRTVLTYADGVRVETLRDATGRVLRRERIDGTGRVTLLDDTLAFAPVQVSRLPPPLTTPAVRLRPGTDPAFGAELVRASTVPLDRTFSLAQIRNITELRALAPVMSSDPVLFQTGSAALSPQQAATLSGIAGVMLELMRTNPREVFLIEGHTDATGSAAFNLALSDRRAETVAQALVDYFGVPPENLVFQGYGEALLAVPTQAAEERNRRVEIRRVTNLLHPWET